MAPSTWTAQTGCTANIACRFCRGVRCESGLTIRVWNTGRHQLKSNLACGSDWPPPANHLAGTCGKLRDGWRVLEVIPEEGEVAGGVEVEAEEEQETGGEEEETEEEAAAQAATEEEVVKEEEAVVEEEGEDEEGTEDTDEEEGEEGERDGGEEKEGRQLALEEGTALALAPGLTQGLAPGGKLQPSAYVQGMMVPVLDLARGNQMIRAQLKRKKEEETPKENATGRAANLKEQDEGAPYVSPPTASSRQPFKPLGLTPGTTKKPLYVMPVHPPGWRPKR